MEDQEFLPKEPLELPVRQAQGEPATDSPKEEYQEVKTLLSWTGPGRPYKRRTKQFFLTVILLAFLFEVIAFLFSQYLLMLVIFFLVLMSFSFVLVPPKNFHYRISTEGITVEDHFYLWQELYDFYFKRREGIDILHVRTHSFLPGELIIPLGDITKEHVRSALLSYLPYREVIKPTFMEKSADLLVKNFPLENTR
jgi:hypothetical protein